MTDLLDNLVPLDDIAQQFFSITPKIARRKAALNMLPVPAFRINGSRKGPLYVKKSDLEAMVQRRYDEAKASNARMYAAGVV